MYIRNKVVTFFKNDNMLDLFLIVFWKRKKWAAAFTSFKNKTTNSSKSSIILSVIMLILTSPCFLYVYLIAY